MAIRNKKKASRGKKYKQPEIPFTKATGMPDKHPTGKSPPSKEERDKLRVCGKWLKVEGHQSRRQRKALASAGGTAVVTQLTSAEFKEARAEIIRKVTGRDFTEVPASKKTCTDLPSRDPTQWEKAYEPINRESYVTGDRNPNAVPIDRVYRDEPCPRIPEDVVKGYGRRSTRYVRKTLHKSQGGYTMITAAEFNENVETRTEMRARKQAVKTPYKRKQHVPKRQFVVVDLVSADEMMGNIIRRKTAAMELVSRKAA
jgi:hypothetical protein